MVPTADHFRDALCKLFQKAMQSGQTVLEITSRDLHSTIGGYPGTNHRMPTCCGVMRQMMQDSDQIVDEPPSGYGARLCIRYELPRKANDSGQTNFSVDTTASLSPHFGRSNEMKWKDFEDHARFHMGRFLGTTFDEKQPPEFPKRFDLVSPDGMIIGDAKFLTLVNGSKLPPAKFMKIAGHVWLLEHTTAKQKFLVFGNQREVAEWWLKKYGCLKTEVDFYFLDRSGNITNLKERLPIIVYMQRLNNALTDGS